MMSTFDFADPTLTAELFDVPVALVLATVDVGPGFVAPPDEHPVTSVTTAKPAVSYAATRTLPARAYMVHSLLSLTRLPGLRQ